MALFISTYRILLHHHVRSTQGTYYQLISQFSQTNIKRYPNFGPKTQFNNTEL